MILFVYIKYCVVMLAAFRWVFIKTAGLEVLFAVETCPVGEKQTSTINPAHKPRRLLSNILLQNSHGTDAHRVNRVKNKNIFCPMYVVMFS